MQRKDLLKSRSYWIADMQMKLFSAIDDFKAKNDLNRSQLAEHFGVTKGYISQVLNGDFNHKISKLVDLALASNKVPVLNFVDYDQYVNNDARNMCYDLIPIKRIPNLTFENSSTTEEQTFTRPKRNKPSTFLESAESSVMSLSKQ